MPKENRDETSPATETNQTSRVVEPSDDKSSAPYDESSELNDRNDIAELNHEDDTKIHTNTKSQSEDSPTQAQEELQNVVEKDEESSDDESSAQRDDDSTNSANKLRKYFKSQPRRAREHVEQQMEEIRHNMGDSYQREGTKLLMHGYLHIQIIRARKLRNMDCLRGCHNSRISPLFLCLANDVSDPYVTVHAGAHRLIKTSTIFDDLNPEWNADYYVPIGHPIEYLEFCVKDWDRMSYEMIGRVLLPVSELIRYGTDGKLQRTGIHQVVHLNGKARNGAFEYYVEYIPKTMMHSTSMQERRSEDAMAVPGVYFQPHQDNAVKLYVDADDKSPQLGAPQVTYGENNKKVYQPNRLWKDIYDTICHAQKFVYIVGWSVDYRQSLLRGEDHKHGLHRRPDGKGHYSSYIGQLLEQKANEGVNVNLLVWDDQTSNKLMGGIIGVRDEELRQYFSNSKVTLRLVPMAAAGNSHLIKKLRQSIYYTHHQKCVMADTPQKELVAYVGGIDLTFGRYDDGSYPLFRSLKGVHSEDFHNACFKVTEESGPRQPWHDIHSQVHGPVVLDLLQNFEERWLGQGGLAKELTDIRKAGLSATAKDLQGSPECWSTQLFRSIDNRTAKLHTKEMKPIHFDKIEGVKFDNEGKQQKAGKKRERLMQKLLHTGKEYQRSFAGNNMEGFVFTRNLHSKRDIHIDNSVQRGLIHHIRNAQHCLYIETQYFLGSAFLWEEHQTQRCCNLIPAEITWKICEKIEAGERFVAYIVVPMWPEGLPDAMSVQDILFYQYQTMQSMYIRIDAALKRRKELLTKAGQKDELSDVKPSDYLNFYCLVNRETNKGGEDDISIKYPLNRTRRHLVYCHSKMTIVDDSVAMIGTANMNQRSLDGNRDSELILASWQPSHLASHDSVAKGEVHAFRLHCFAHLTGVMEDVFRDPSSLECVRRVNDIAEKTWKLYCQDEVCDLKSHLAPYPIQVMEGGKVVARTANGKFPDTNANILGSKPTLPSYLTT